MEKNDKQAKHHYMSAGVGKEEDEKGNKAIAEDCQSCARQVRRMFVQQQQ